MQLDQRGLGDSEGVIESPELLTTVMGAREAIEDTEDEQVLQKYNEIFNLQSKSCVQARLSIICSHVEHIQIYFKGDVSASVGSELECAKGLAHWHNCL